MSLNDRMKAQFLEQGGLKALLQLALSTRDEESVTNCAACLVNLVAFGDYYDYYYLQAGQLLEAGVVPATVRICHAFGVGAGLPPPPAAVAQGDDPGATAGASPRIVQYCALTLCALSSNPNIEEWLIRDGAVPCLTRLLPKENNGTNDHAPDQRQGAHQPRVRDGGQPGAEHVKNLMNTFADIVVATPTTDVRQLIAESIKSLSCLAVARRILQKQGVIATLKAILIGSKRAQTTNACAIARGATWASSTAAARRC